MNFLKSLTNTVKHWYIPLILGIIFIVFGIYIFSTPLETYLTLSFLFSLSFIVTGIAEIAFSITNIKALNGWGWYLVNGLLSLIIGIYLVAYPGTSAIALAFVVGFVVLFRSFQLLGFSLDIKDTGIGNWKGLAALSILGIILSFLLLANPLFTGISLVTFTALSFIFAGGASISLSLYLKKIKNYPGKLTDELKGKIETLQKEVKQHYEKN